MDDSAVVREVMQAVLGADRNIKVIVAADPLIAFAKIEREQPHVVVTDLEMPRTNGYELISHMRQNAATRYIPIMVVTSRAGAKHRERALKEGAASFMVKPVQEDAFVAEVAALIGGASQAAAVGSVQ